MELTVKSATIQFGEGQTVGLLIGIEYYNDKENLYGSIQVPLDKIKSMAYGDLEKAVKEELGRRFSEGVE